jgi:integrase/recombinase XerD
MELHIYPLSIEATQRIAVVNTQFSTEFPIKMKQINGSLWTPDYKCWHIPYTKETWQLFEQLFEGHTIIREIKTAEKSIYPEGSSTIHLEQVLETFKVSETLLTPAPKETCIIAQRCATEPDRIFLTIPDDHLDWQTYVNQVKNSTYHATEKLWSIPRNKELYTQFAAYFGESLVVDKETPIVLTDVEATYPPIENGFQLRSSLDGQYVKKARVKIEKITFDNQHFIGVHIHYSDMENREKIKTIEGRSWHKLAKLWVVPYTVTTYKRLQETFKDDLEIVSSPNERAISSPMPTPKLMLKPEFEKSKHAFKEIDNTAIFYSLNREQQKAVSALENLLIEERKAYKTRQGYRNIFIQFLFQHPNTLPDNISNAQMKTFIVKRIKEEDISKSTHNQIISTLKAYYGRFLEHPDRVANLYRPDKEEHLPKMMTPDEIRQMLKQVGNLKHKCMLMLLYGSGLRVGELVRLQLKDLDFEEKTVFVDTGKHYKDRYTIFSEKSIVYLKKYLAEHTPKPQSWVFESPDGGHYSERSVQQIFTEARDKARIKKQLNTHSFRHAFATELLKASSDLDFVRKVMGHASIKTTQIYLHVIRKDLTKTKSPLDNLDI